MEQVAQAKPLGYDRVSINLYEDQQDKVTLIMETYKVDRSTAIRWCIDAANIDTLLDEIRYRFGRITG